MLNCICKTSIKSQLKKICNRVKQNYPITKHVKGQTWYKIAFFLWPLPRDDVARLARHVLALAIGQLTGNVDANLILTKSNYIT